MRFQRQCRPGIDLLGSASGVVPSWHTRTGHEPALEKKKEQDMGTRTLERVLTEVKMLSQEEQQQLRDTLDRWLQHDRPEDRLEHVLVEAGLLRTRRPQAGDTTPSTSFAPVAVRGRPVSETLIEERR